MRVFLALVMLLFSFDAHSHDLKQLPPIDQAGVTHDQVFSWLPLAVTEAMSFSFNDFEGRLKKASRHFTDDGYQSFRKALDRSRILEMVEVNKQVVRMVSASAPILIKEGVVQGVYEWTIEMPVVVTYFAGDKQRSDRLRLVLVVKRSNESQNEMGFGIRQWVAYKR
ncbi:MAG: DotI/IcmL family type IV secretion protein [Bdellovibrionales bacterium]